LTPYVSQGSAATDLIDGGSFNSFFIHRSFLNLTVKKKYENWSTFAKVIKIKVLYFLRHEVFSGVKCLQDVVYKNS